MQFGEYQFVCRLESEAQLPDYKGSTLRGVFGHALKRVVCTLKRQECPDCLLKQRCLYARVFETPIAMTVPEGAKISTPPHPFVIEPPLTLRTHFKAGETLACNLLLFGDVNDSLAYFVYAFEQMGRIGLGKRINGKRTGFTLVRVRQGEQDVYTDADRTLRLPDTVQTLEIKAASHPDGGPMQLAVEFITPLRMKFKNTLNDALPFHVLARAMLRRASSLLNCYGRGEPALDYKALVDRAKQVEIIKNELKWFDWQRYSHRQKRAMPLGGVTGRIVYQGDLRPYLPLLEFCNRVHLGKNTTFGLGKMAIKF